MLKTALITLLLLAAPASVAQQPPEDCDALYDGKGTAQDFRKALACFRAQDDWMMVAIMQLNGEGTPVDVAGARATFRRAMGGRTDMDADEMSLDAIIKKREANLTAKAPRIDFCNDVAATTLSLNPCARQELDRQSAKDDLVLKRVRDHLTSAAREPFDRTLQAFEPFVTAESGRAYQEYIDGSIRNQFAIGQEALLRENFLALIKTLGIDAAGKPPSARRPLADADRELNAVYRDRVRSYTGDFEQRAAESQDPAQAATYRTYAADYRTKARDAQRLWIRYRDAAADLAVARWPDSRTIRDIFKARITEDRIRELRNSVGE